VPVSQRILVLLRQDLGPEEADKGPVGDLGVEAIGAFVPPGGRAQGDIDVEGESRGCSLGGVLEVVAVGCADDQDVDVGG
jgi:hypothetical protein